MAFGNRSDVKQLLLQVDASVALAQRNLAALANQVDRDTGRINRDLGRVDDASDRLGRNFGRLSAMAGTFGVALGGVGITAGARQFLEYADAAKSMEAQLRLATAASGSFGQAQEDVRRIAQAARSGLEETAQLYGALMRNSAELGITQEQAARATQTLVETFTISGAGAEEASNATRQFMQALQSGTLRGDEFNSVMENAPRLAQLLATSLGKTVGELRAMAEQGQLTSARLTTALTDQRFTAGIDAEFAQLPVTFEQATTQIHNAALVAFGAFDRGGEFSEMLVNFMLGGVENLEQIETKAEDTGIVVRSIFAGLDNVFDPLGDHAQDVFDSIRQMAVEARNDIGLIFGLWDAAAAGLRELAVASPRALPQLGGNYASHWLDRNLPEATPVRPRYMEGVQRSEQRGRLDAQQRESSARLNEDGFSRWLADPETYDMQGNRRRPTSPRRAASTGSSGARSRSRAEPERTPRQAWEDFRAELAERGIRPGAGRTGFRTARDQAEINANGESPLSGRPGDMSRHQTWQALDPSRATHNAARAREAAAAAGLRGFEVVPESRGRFHYEWAGHEPRRGGAPQEAQRLEQVRDERRRNDERFAQEYARAEDELLRIRQNQATSAAEVAAFELEAVDREENLRRLGIVREVQEGRYTEEQGRALAIACARVAHEQRQMIAQRERDRIDQEGRDVAAGLLRIEADEEQARAALAETTAERRASALQLLEISQQQERESLKGLLAQRDLSESTRKLAEEELGRMATRHAYQKEAIEREHEGPRDRYLRELRVARSDLDELLDETAIDGFERLNDELARSVAGFLELGGVAGRVLNQIVEDLLRIAIQQRLVGPLAEAFFGGGGAGGGGTWDKFLGGAMSLAGAAAGSGGGLLSFGGTRAGGGPVEAGFAYLVGERGPEIVVPRQPSVVIPNHAIGRGGSGGVATVRLELSSDIDARVVRVSGGVAVEVVRSAAPAIQEGTIRELTRPALA